MNKHLFSFLSWFTITVTTCWLNLSVLWAEGIIGWSFVPFFIMGLITIGLNVLYGVLCGPLFKSGKVDWGAYMIFMILTGFILGLLTTEWLTRWTDIIPVLP